MYHLNIFGNGRVTLSLLKMIFDQDLDRYISKITVWCRERKVLLSNKVITIHDNVNEEIIRIHLMQKAAGSRLNRKEEKIEFKTLASIDDLVNLNTGNDKDVLILAVKYDLDDLIYTDKTKRQRFNPNNSGHLELLLSRMKAIVPGISSYDLKQGYTRKKLLGDLNRILDEKQLVNMTINELSQSSSAGYTRLYNLEHSAIGVKYLAQVLKDYNGIIFNMINEVDTTNYILQHFSKLKPERIMSPCENDIIRSRYFLRKHLKSNGINANTISLNYLGPHNHSGFIPPETVKVDGRLLTEILDIKTVLALLEEVTNKVNGFGEDIFLKKGSSDEDTVVGVCCTLSSLFNKSKSIVRVSCYDKNDKLFSGVSGFFRGEQFNLSENVVSELSPESRERLFNANKEQILINQRIMSAIG